VAQAGAVLCEASKRMFPWYYNPENEASLLSVQTRLCACLVVLDPDWTSETATIVPSWTQIGLEGGIDTLLAGVAIGGEVKIERRGQLLKEIGQQDPVVFPSSFWATKPSRIRRGLAAGAAAIPAGLYKHGVAQMKFIEEDTRTTLLIDGKTFYAPTPLTIPNPTARFAGEPMHATRTPERLVVLLAGYEARGLLKLHTADELNVLERPALLALLEEANYPTFKIPSLQADIALLRVLILRLLNTFLLKIYGDGATLVETWPTSLWSVGIFFLLAVD
jgi:hypothetical protein